jgi:hypothetical protein
VVINEIMYNERKKPSKGSRSPRATKQANLRRARARAETAASDLLRRAEEETRDEDEDEKSRFRVPAGAAAAPAYGDDETELLTPRRAFVQTGGDWIELHNPGTTAVSLEGWTVRGSRNGDDDDDDDDDDDAFVVPSSLLGSSLAPGGYLVLARDVARFRRKHADVTSVLDASFEFNLSAKGEMVSLYDASGRLVDFVEYDDGKGWPSSADGEGFSLELISPKGMDRNDPFSWVPSARVGGTPGRANGAGAE